MIDARNICAGANAYLHLIQRSISGEWYLEALRIDYGLGTRNLARSLSPPVTTRQRRYGARLRP
jgi:hypothetical protein